MDGTGNIYGTPKKARALPWTRRGRRPQTPILSVRRLASTTDQIGRIHVLRALALPYAEQQWRMSTKHSAFGPGRFSVG
jgi:predicted secreted protein